MADNHSFEPENVYMEPLPPSYEMSNITGRQLPPNVSSKESSSNAVNHSDVKNSTSSSHLCRIFLMIVASFIIGGIIGGAISYLWTSREYPGCADITLSTSSSDRSCPICQTGEETSSTEAVKPEWQLVFKAVSGVAGVHETDQLLIDPYEIWKRPVSYNENIPEAKQLDASFRGHYQSPFVLNWRRVLEVKICLLDENGNELISLIFDAEGSDRMNWFSKDRLLSSPWGDVFIEPQNYFSISGTSGSTRTRRWYLNRNHEGCHNDAGWLVIVGKKAPPYCPWETDGSKNANPVFLYSKRRTYTNWNTEQNVGEADIFAIFVKTY